MTWSTTYLVGQTVKPTNEDNQAQVGPLQRLECIRVWKGSTLHASNQCLLWAHLQWFAIRAAAADSNMMSAHTTSVGPPPFRGISSCITAFAESRDPLPWQKHQQLAWRQSCCARRPIPLLPLLPSKHTQKHLSTARRNWRTPGAGTVACFIDACADRQPEQETGAAACLEHLQPVG